MTYSPCYSPELDQSPFFIYSLLEKPSTFTELDFSSLREEDGVFEYRCLCKDTLGFEQPHQCHCTHNITKRVSRSFSPRGRTEIPATEHIVHCSRPESPCLNWSYSSFPTDTKPKLFKHLLKPLYDKNNHEDPRAEIIYSISRPKLTGAACFTSKPPPQPLRLVFQGLPPLEPPGDKRMKSLLENIRKIDILNEKGFWSSFTSITDGDESEKESVSAKMEILKKSIHTGSQANCIWLANSLAEKLDRVERMITSSKTSETGTSRAQLNIALFSSVSSGDVWSAQMKLTMCDKRTQMTQSSSSGTLRPKASVACDCLTICTSSTPSLCHIAVQVEDKRLSCGDSFHDTSINIKDPAVRKIISSVFSHRRCILTLISTMTHKNKIGIHRLIRTRDNKTFFYFGLLNQYHAELIGTLYLVPSFGYSNIDKEIPT